MPAPRRRGAFGRRSASRRTAAYSGVREPASTGHGGRPVAPPRRAGRGPRGPLGTGAGAAPVRREQASAYRGGIGAAPWGVMRLSVLPLATLGVLAGGSALGQSPSPALGQGWAGELRSRGGAASSDAAGSTGAGLLDGSLSYSFDNGLTAKAELEGNGLLGSDGAGGTVQAWWEDPSLGLIGAFAEASRSDGLWQRRFVFHGELYLGPFTLLGQAGIAPPTRRGRGSSREGSSASSPAAGIRSTRLGSISARRPREGAALSSAMSSGHPGSCRRAACSRSMPARGRGGPARARRRPFRVRPGCGEHRARAATRRGAGLPALCGRGIRGAEGCAGTASKRRSEIVRRLRALRGLRPAAQTRKALTWLR